jgi:hypothetical protein
MKHLKRMQYIYKELKDYEFKGHALCSVNDDSHPDAAKVPDGN